MPVIPDMQPVSEYVPSTESVIVEILREQQRTNQLLADLLQSNWALIEAMGESEQQAEPGYDMDGNRRAVADNQSAYMDLP